MNTCMTLYDAREICLIVSALPPRAFEALLTLTPTEMEICVEPATLVKVDTGSLLTLLHG